MSAAVNFPHVRNRGQAAIAVDVSDHVVIGSAAQKTGGSRGDSFEEARSNMADGTPPRPATTIASFTTTDRADARVRLIAAGAPEDEIAALVEDVVGIVRRYGHAWCEIAPTWTATGPRRRADRRSPESERREDLEIAREREAQHAKENP